MKNTIKLGVMRTIACLDRRRDDYERNQLTNHLWQLDGDEKGREAEKRREFVWEETNAAWQMLSRISKKRSQSKKQREREKRRARQWSVHAHFKQDCVWAREENKFKIVQTETFDW